MFNHSRSSSLKGYKKAFRRQFAKLLQIFFILIFLTAAIGMNPTGVASADTTPPAAPLGLTALAGDAQVELTWSANKEADLAGYNVYRSETSPVTLPADPINGTTLVSSPTYHDAGLTNGVKYFYVVTAVNTSTQESPASGEVSDTPAPRCSANPIVAENCLSGNPSSEWDISGAGDANIQGYATDISVNHGDTVHFKVKTDSKNYRLDIYRLGYYGEDGARKIATVQRSAPLPQSQPDCLFDATNADNLVDCGNWGESASWHVPNAAVSGIYIAKLVRQDATAGESQIIFIVRNDESHSDLLFQTSDTTWQAYNGYGGYSLYANSLHAHKVSYNRPFTTRATPTEDNLFNAEYPMLRWLERNGYDMTYSTDLDTDIRGDLLKNHKVFLSVGHDEYWSAGQRAAVEAARGAGVNLAFFSGNEVYWKTRWEPSTDTSHTPNRTLVSYKEGALAPGEHYDCDGKNGCDPLTAGISPVWTGLWRDGCMIARGDACLPENALSGNISWDGNTSAITVPAEDGKMRFWRNTAVGSQLPGATQTLTAGTLGYEWDFQQYESYYPAGRVLLSTTNYDGRTHHLSLYRAGSGALVFSSGTVQWSWGLDSKHDRGSDAADPSMQQATVNLLADMRAQPATLQTGLVAATASTDTTPPTSTITIPSDGAAVDGNVTIIGTAADTGGVVGGVEISVDGGSTWKQAIGRENWSYLWAPTTLGSVNIKTRAVDDSGNIESPSAGITVTVGPHPCPCSLWDASNPAGSEDSDTGAVEVGVKFRSDVAGFVSGIRFYKHTNNTGSHIGNLWNASGQNLGSVIFTSETASGWQEADFDTPIAISAGTTYVASYFTPTGHYASSEGFFAASSYDNPPLHALQDSSAPGGTEPGGGSSGGEPNGVYKYSTLSVFPDTTWHSANYWVDVAFVTVVGPDITPPHVLSSMPVNNARGIALNTAVTATFSEAMDATTIGSSTFELRDGSSTLVPATVNYDAASRKATLTPNAALSTSTTYTATIKGGTGGVSDVASPPNYLVSDYTWSFMTSAPTPPPPDEGPGGPILVIADASNASNPFGRYYAEILRGEGFNAFSVTDISKVSADTLTAYDVVLLGEMSLTSAQVTMFDNWVNGGGNLIAFRPDKSLAALYGLTEATGTTSEGYLAVNTSTSIGKGVAGDTMQFHGTADHYNLSTGATSQATLYSNATVATDFPAITSYARGSGQVVIFTFDLARSIILMRQGNPAWAGQEGDGAAGIRASDMFVHSGQPNWIDNNKILIPQADEQMHVLSHAIEQLTVSKLPLPRLWYFPNQIKGALIMTGDSEGCEGSCVDVPMQDVNAHGGHYTAYLLGTQPTSDQVATWLGAGNGVGVHYDDTSNANNPTYANMNAVYDSMTLAFHTAYSYYPTTVRNHWIVWTGWADQAKIEAAHGIGLDTNYYHWGAWATGPGYFTGSGLPLRFSDETGQILDIFQSTTQLPDETWGQNIYTDFKTLIDRSLDQGYYGFLNANFHPPSYGTYQSQADSMMNYANSRGVPIWSAEMLNDFLRARNQGRTENMSWNGALLKFDFNALTPYSGLTLMIPAKAGGQNLLSLKIGSTPVTYHIATVKGYDYALFTAADGSYTASYEQDTTAPTITSKTPAENAVDVASNANLTVTFSEAMKAATISGTTFSLRANGAASDVAATVSYDDTSMTARLNPNANLAYSTVYHVTVSGTVADASNNQLGSDQTWSFTTADEPPPSVSDTSVADFTAGTVNSCLVDDAVGDGAVRLGAAIDETFSGSGTTLPTGWSAHQWAGNTLPTLGGGLLTVDGAYARNDTLYGPGHTLDFVATFRADAYQHVGFGANDPTFNNGPWIMFSTGADGSQLYVRINPSATADNVTPLGAAYFGSPHQYRIIWNSDSIDLLIDGQSVATSTLAIAGPMRVAVSDLNSNSTTLTADWLRMIPPYNTPCTFTSRVFDAGGTVNWGAMAWNAILPTGTGLAFSFRTGNTPAPGASWTGFSGVASSGGALNASSRYLQYQAILSASDVSQTPVLQDITITYANGGADLTPPSITSRTPAASTTGVPANTTATVTFSEAMNPGSITGSTFSLRADGAGSDIPAAVTYDDASMTATLNPNANLAYSTVYHVTVSGSVMDAANNQLGSPDTWSFTTQAAPPLSLTDTTVADFTAGTLDSCVADATIGDGAVRLPLTIDEAFSGISLPSGWSTYQWNGSTTAPAVAGGLLSVNASEAYMTTGYTSGHMLEFAATFAAAPYQHIGFGGPSGTPSVPYNVPPWIMFSTGDDGLHLYARVLPLGSTSFNTGNDKILIGDYLGSLHTYKIDWKADSIDFYVDGVLKTTVVATINDSMQVSASDYASDSTSLTVDWLRVSPPFASPCTFTSRVFDGGGGVNWAAMSWNALVPAGAALALSYRTGNTPAPDGSWTGFAGVATSGAPLSSSSRYLQYRAVLSASDTSPTPVLQDVTLQYTTGGPDHTPPSITGRAPAANTTGLPADTNVTVTFNEAMNEGTISNSTFSVLADGAGSDVAATVSYDAASMMATLNPNANLDYSTLYHVTVSGSVADAANNQLGSADTWSFTTAAAPDLTPPTITGRTPAANATDVASSANVTVTFSEAMNAVSISGSSFSLRADGAGNDVTAAVSYDAGSMTATLNPNSDLAYSTLYHVSVSASVTDVAGNPLSGAASWSFTTAAAPLPVLADTTAADFSLGTLNSCVADSTIGDGAVRLPSPVDVDFSGTTLPTGWSSYDWPLDSKTGAYLVSGGLLTVDGMRVNPDPAAYSPSQSLEFVATFVPTPNQHIGLANGNNIPPNEIFNNSPQYWAMFSTGPGTSLQARTWSDAGHTDLTLSGSWTGAPHRYRIDWTSTSATYFIDGVQVASQAYSAPAGITVRPAISDLTQDGTVLTVDWMRLLSYVSPCTFTSRVFDAGQPANWDTISWTSNLPTNTAIGLSYRIGSSSDLSSAQWMAITGSSPKSLVGNSRYIQYQATLSSSNTTVTPDLRDVTFAFHTGADTTPPTISALSAVPDGSGNAVIAWNTDEPSNSLVAYGTAPDALSLSANSAAFVTAHTITLTGLAVDTTYYYRVTSKDAANNSTTSPASGNSPASFATPPVTNTLTDTSTADFNAGTLNSCVADATIGDGALRLPFTIDEGFLGSALPGGWTNYNWTGSNPTVSDGLLTVNGSEAYTSAQYAPSHTLEFAATFAAAGFQHVGFGGTPSGAPFVPFNGPPWIMFSTGDGSQLRVRIQGATGLEDVTNLGSTYFGVSHTYRIVWTATQMTFYIDGSQVASKAIAITTPMNVSASDYNSSAPSLTVDWLRMTPYVSPCTYTSRIFDAGQLAHWIDLSKVGPTPTGASVSFQTRTGNTAVPDGTWSAWQAVNSPIANPNGRYIQYQATLATTDTIQTPVVESVSLTYSNLAPRTISGNAGVAGATLSYTDGGPKTVTANGAGAYSLTVPYGWSGTVTPSMTGYTFAPISTTYTNLTADKPGESYTATLNTFALSVSKTGSGTITSSPTGINCGATCSANYAYNTPVTLSAAPVTGWTFTGWGGACAGTGTCAVTMDAAESVSATFVQDVYALNITIVGSGGVTRDPADSLFVSGTPVNLTAVPAAGWSFSGWSGDLTGSTNPSSITMDSAKVITATFTQNEYTLVITSDHGTVNPDKPAPYHYGDVVQLTAAPAAGWIFDNWTGDATGTTNPVSVTIHGNTSITANYSQPCYTLATAVVPSAGGTIAVPTATNCTGGYQSGTVVTVNLTKNAGQIFSGWSGDASGVATTISVTMNGDKSVTANFRPSVVLLTPNGAQTSWTSAFNWTGVPDATYYLLQVYNSNHTPIHVEWYAAGTNCNGLDCSVTLGGLADLASGEYSWSVRDLGPYGPGGTSLYGPATDSMGFSIERACYTLATAVVPSAGGTIAVPTATNCTGGYQSGTVVTVNLTKNAGQIFSGWSGDASGVATTISVTMNGDKSVTANFRPSVVLLTPNGAQTSWTSAFNWTGVPDATYYLLQVYNSNHTPIHVEWYAAGTNCNGLDCSVTLGGLADLASGEYSWSVRDLGPYGPGGTSLYGPATDSMGFSIERACYTLATAVVPSAGGTIAVPTATNCTGGYQSGTVVTVNLTKNAGQIFSGWSGDASGVATTISVTMNGDKSVTANFRPSVVLLTPNGAQTSWTSAFNWTGVPDATYYLLQVYNSNHTPIHVEWYAAGTNCNGLDCSVTLGGLADLASGEYSWSVRDLGPYGPGGTSLYGPATDSMGFSIERACYTLATAVVPSAGGTIAVPTATNCTGGYQSGTVVTVNLTKNAGQIFSGWSGDASGVATTISVTMNGDKSVTANFRPSVVLLTPNGAQTSWTSAFNWTGVPDATYYLLQVYNSNHTPIHVEWYAAGTNCNGLDCSVTLGGLADLASGEYSWSVRDLGPYGPGGTSLYGPATDSMGFSIERACYTLATAVVPSAGGTIAVPTATNCTGGYQSGTVVTVNLTKNAGQIFSGWSGDASGVATTISVTMNGDKSVTANFRPSVVLLTPNGAQTSWTSAFNWTGVPDATYYLLQVYNSNHTPIHVEWYAAGTNCNGLDCSVTLGGLADLASGEYSWSVRDLGPYGPGGTSLYGPATDSMGFSIERACYTLATAVVPSAGGTIAVPTATNCTGGYQSGTVVTVNLTKNAGQIFSGWSGDASGVATTISVTMNGDKSVTANFRPSVVLLTPNGAQTSWTSAFNWTGVPDATYYLLQVYNSNHTPIHVEWYAAGTNCNGLDCSVTLGGLADLASGEYSWSVRDLGPYGPGGTSLYGPATDSMGFSISR